MTAYATIADFYKERGGLMSGEQDYGVHWLEDGGFPHDRLRVSIVHDTGDVYAVSMWTEKVELLGNVPADVACDPKGIKHVEGCCYLKCDVILDGWEDHPRPLSWARERLS